MEDHSQWPAGDFAAQHRAMSDTIDKFGDELRAASQAMMRRSAVCSAMGDRQGALRDAQAALAIFPGQAEYLIRTAEALLDVGQQQEAFEVFQRAGLAVESETNDTTVLEADLARLKQRLRPLERLPDEVLSMIFEWVHADWERLPSPFQLCQVSQRWRDLAESTPSLWRDLRILRVEEKLPTEGVSLSSSLSSTKVRRPYLFMPENFLPEERDAHPRDQNHVQLIQECARRSHDSLTHFEFQSLHSDENSVKTILEVANKSSATLLSISIAQNDESVLLPAAAFHLALSCPRLAELELNLGRVDVLANERIEELVKDLPALPATLRTLKLDSMECLRMRQETPFAQLFLQRCSKIETLKISDNAESGIFTLCGIKVVVACAETLIDLETSGQAGLFYKLKANGIRSMPKLRRFRHLSTSPSEPAGTIPFDFRLLELPSLECLEGPLEMIASGKKKPLPARVVLRCDVRDPCRVEDIAAWLRDPLTIGEQMQEVKELTIEFLALDQQDVKQLHTVLEALTPDSEGSKVVCPNLTNFSVLVRDEFARGGEVNRLAVDSIAQPTPIFREQWESKLDVSRVVRMMERRRRAAMGLPVEKAPQHEIERPASAFQRGSRAAMKQPAQATAAPPSSTSPPRCVALQSVTLEGCYVEEAAWKVMKEADSLDLCHFEVTPDPEVMALLPFEGPTKRKKTKLGERRVHAW